MSLLLENILSFCTLLVRNSMFLTIGFYQPRSSVALLTVEKEVVIMKLSQIECNVCSSRVPEWSWRESISTVVHREG
jgi:hypothetical protein